MLSQKYLTFCFFETNQAPLLKFILRKQCKFLVIRLAARIMSLFVYTFLTGKIMKLQDIQLLQEESQQSKGQVDIYKLKRCLYQYPNRKYQDLPKLEKIKSLFYCTSTFSAVRVSMQHVTEIKISLILQQGVT